MDKLTIRDIDFCDKRVLIRVDYNVPLDIESGEITDDSRIKASIPTITANHRMYSGCKAYPIQELTDPANNRTVEINRTDVTNSEVSTVV